MTLAFLSLILLLAAGLGEAVLDKLRVPGLSRLEVSLFGIALGMGSLSLGITALGLIGLLTRDWISALLVGTAAATGPRLVGVVRRGGAAVRAMPANWRAASPLAKAFILLAAAIGLLALAQALTPPWDYDGLMYHLVGPRLFLDAGRIIPYPDNWYVNGPFSIEMLFSIGMAFGDDVLPKLIHLGFSLVLLGATWSAARRWLPEGQAWLAPAILLTVPTLPIFSAFAYIDLGWSSFEFLALLAFVLWWESRSERMLVLAGLMIGFAMGSKYHGLQGFALMGLLILIGTRPQGIQGVVRSGLALGLPAVLIALPWYLKNYLWFGNPVFPLFFGGPGWDTIRLGLYNAYLDSFGVGRKLVDYVMLPINIFTRHASFGAVMNKIDLPSLLFPLAVVYPFTKRVRPISILLALAAGRFVLWAAGSQQTRFLLPIFPALALGSAHVIGQIRIGRGSGRLIRMSLQALCVGLLVIPLFYQALILVQSSGVGTITGVTSRRAFLGENVTGFRVFNSAPPAIEIDRVLLLGDGRAYYCSPACIPDPDHFRWAAEIERTGTCAEVRAWMESIEAGAIMFNLQDIDFLLQHDPAGVLSSAVRGILDETDDGCLRQVYREGSIRIYALDGSP